MKVILSEGPLAGRGAMSKICISTHESLDL